MRNCAATEIASRLTVAACGERTVAARTGGERARTTQAATGVRRGEGRGVDRARGATVSA
jgi:hypothetical protein